MLLIRSTRESDLSVSLVCTLLSKPFYSFSEVLLNQRHRTGQKQNLYILWYQNVSVNQNGHQCIVLHVIIIVNDRFILNLILICNSAAYVSTGHFTCYIKPLKIRMSCIFAYYTCM